MADAFEIIECKRTATGGSPAGINEINPSMEAALQSFIDDANTPSSWDRASYNRLGPNRLALFIEYTSA